jgi:hypothetical protein
MYPISDEQKSWLEILQEITIRLNAQEKESEHRSFIRITAKYYQERLVFSIVSSLCWAKILTENIFKKLQSY